MILTTALITLLLFIGLGPLSSVPEHTRYLAAFVMAFVTLAASWYGHSSTPGASIYLKAA